MLADILIVDVARVYPDDRLVEDLGFGRVDGLGPGVPGIRDVEEAFGVDLAPVWRSEITLRDLVTYVSAAATGTDT